VEGIAKSVNHPHIYGLDIRVSLLDKERKLISDAIYFSIPPQMANGDYRQFNLTLKGKPTSGSLLQFLYRYDVEEQDQKFHWVNSFEVDVATGVVRQRE
jgi:hypothetical protein